MQKYNLVVCGATFDHFHRGHESFLRFALKQGKKVLLGLTSDEFARKNRLRQEIEPYVAREQATRNFLKKIDTLQRVEIMPIHTLFIPKEWENLPIEAIVISKDVASGADAINNKRSSEGKTQLKILYCPTILAEDGIPISSIRIRNGVIDREGKMFVNPLWNFPLHITPALRKALKEPFGSLIKNPEIWFKNQNFNSESIITVGDIVTKTFNEHNVGHKISVIDFFVAREKKFSDITEHGFTGREKVIDVVNPAGTLTKEVFTAFKNIYRNPIEKRSIMLVEGEEDLVVLPVILSTPLGTKIYYGQPNIGIVEILATEERKRQTYSIVKQFK